MADLGSMDDAQDESELLDLLPGIRRFFQRRVTASEADDLTQEVYLHMRARSSDAAIKNLRGYLLTVAANVLNEKARGDRVRCKASHTVFHEQGFSSEHNTPERIVLQRDQIDVMVAVIQELPPRTRDVFLLHRFEEMTYEDIAQQMGISSSGVEKHIMRALRHLTQRLGTGYRSPCAKAASESKRPVNRAQRRPARG